MKTVGIKGFLKQFVLTRPIYHAWRYLREYRIRNIRKNMRTKGTETVLFLENLLSGKVFFYMDMGTMLGIVREGHLIGHDLDIDVAVYADTEGAKERVKQLLLAAGCTLKYTYYADLLGVVEQSFEYKKLKFDINYYVKDGDKDICYLMYCDPQKVYTENELDVVKLVVSSVRAVKQIPFAGKEVTVPEHPDTYLSERYGEDWRIPNPDYVYWKGPSCEYTGYKGYKKIEES